MESEKLTGKVAIITGAGRGMGKSIAIGLAKQGAEVSIASRTEKELQDLESEITKFGGKTKYFVTDVGLEEQAIALVQNTVSHFGRLDILINNAGVGAGGPWEHTKTEDYDRVMAINVRGPFILCRESVPHLREQGGGHIINILSIGGVQNYEFSSIYAASKNALRSLTITLSKDLRKDNIRVHGLGMGAVDTPLMRSGLSHRPDLDVRKLIQPEEIADIVHFLVTWKGNGVIDEINIRRPDAKYWA